MQKEQSAGQRRRIQVTLPRVFAIALPMTIAYASTPLLGLVDTGVAGRLDDVTILAGLAIGAVLFDLIFSTFNFLRSSVVGLTAQAYGAGDDREIDAIFLRALALALASGVVIIVLSPLLIPIGLWFFNADGPLANVIRLYFLVRALSMPMALANYVILGHFLGLGKSGTTLGLQLILNGVNMAFSILLGLSFGFGIAGIAAATVIGETLAMVTGLAIYLHRRKGQAWPDRATLTNADRLAKFFALNRDITIRSFCLVFAFMFFTRIGTEFGEDTLAANAVLMHIFLLSGYLLDGFATAAEQMAGQSLGARDRPNYSLTVRLTLICGGAFSTALFFIYWIIHGWFIDLLVLDETVRQIARDYILWAAFTPLAGFVAFQMDGIYIGSSWGREMRNSMLVSLVLFTAIALIAGWQGNNHLLWLALTVFLAMRGITLSLALPAKMRENFGPA